MPGKIERHDRQAMLQCPVNQVTIQPHMIIVAMQNDQRAAGLGRQPDLDSHGELIDLDAAEVLRCMVTEVDTVIGGVAPRGCIQPTARIELRQSGDQQVQKNLIHSFLNWSIFDNPARRGTGPHPGRHRDAARYHHDTGRDTIPRLEHDLQPIIV